ncbi:histidinol-phosphate transaminase [Virgibacillus oceani]|uniref:Histidinol-phosphate aminotransferase n=1 Tax=Virgibacillus oceani TaxID=1479511 RepID=A0A917LXE8_9BACI|nr:histidinol-phosphate transaminase [Virgibacillus oceani]GGG65312.1 histidinol-phosphate aminotransferase [Virgibacillus oceani]
MKGKRILSEMTPYKQGMQIEEVKKEYGLKRIVKLASNENPFGYSRKLQEQLPNMLHDFEIYPDGHTAELRTALAEKLRVNENQLVFGSGSDELVQLTCRAFLYPGVNTVMANPTFPQYKHNAKIEGAEIREIPNHNGYHDLEAIFNAIDENTRVVWLCSPNNPTGCLIPRSDFYSFMDKCPKDVLVVLDEAYYEYIEPGLDPDAINNISNYPNLLILRTFSKAYGLAGLRIGYGVGSERLIAKLNVVRGPFNTTSYTQKAALIALHDDLFIQETYQQNKVIRESFQRFLDNLGLSYYDSHTNFLCVKLPVSGNEMFGYLLKNGYIVRPGEGIGCPNSVRITIGNKEDMIKLQSIIHEFITS